MRKLLFLAMAGFAMIGCTTTSYSVMNVNSQPKDFDTYKKVKTKVTWSQTYKDFGCSVQDYFDHFPMFDEILDVVVTEKHVKTTFLMFGGDESFCQYTGVGVKFKKDLFAPPGKHVVNEDGTESWTDYNPDGSYHVRNSAGWEIWFDKNGEKKRMKFSDGTEKTY